MINMREVRGAKLYTDGYVCMTEDAFYVQSESDMEMVYKVQDNQCECKDFQSRKISCKHLHAVEYYFLCNGE